MYLWDDKIGKGLGAQEQLLGALKLQGLLVVLQVVLDAVVDVGDLANVVLARLKLVVLLQFGPATVQQLPGLAVVQLQL